MRCSTENFTIAKFFQWKNSINLSPEYQRQGHAWALAKKQLFLDTLFREYDVPKIYMHKLPTNGGLHIYSLVDGKQRLQCIWDFLGDAIPLGDFDYAPARPPQKNNKPYPQKGDTFSDLSPFWQDEFKAISLATVIIEDANTADGGGDDIEDLFLRLNNGEPLNAAEKRNAMVGDMCRLVRELAEEHDFFQKVLPISNARYQHLDLAARFLLIENSKRQTQEPFCILKKKFLDDLVKNNRQMSAADSGRLKTAVVNQLNSLCKIFKGKNELLKKAGYSQLYYLFVKEVETHYASEKLFSEMSDFLVYFDQKRTAFRADDNELHETGDDYARLAQFELFMQQGNDKLSLKTRVEIMKEFFLRKNPNTKSLDPKRNFSEGERRAVYYSSGGKCAKCEKKFNNFGDFEADHVIQWAHGGETTLANAQALCKSCNAKKNKKVA